MTKEFIGKYLGLFGAGGIIYVMLELLWQQKSHWTMLILGGLCFMGIGMINEWMSKSLPLWIQAFLGAGIVTALEFIAGCLINLLLKWHVWDYSDLRRNLLGQICPQYTLLWIPLSLVAVFLDDWIRYRYFHGKKPTYRIF